MDFKITVIEDRAEYDALKRRLRTLDGAVVEAGLHDPEQAQKGAWNEFGTRTIPARPWMAPTADNNRERYADQVGAAVGDVCDGVNARKAMKPVSTYASKTLVDAIEAQRVGGPPLAASTVRAKGHGRKLIDTGAMLRSIKSRVTRDRQGGGS